MSLTWYVLGAVMGLLIAVIYAAMDRTERLVAIGFGIALGVGMNIYAIWLR